MTKQSQVDLSKLFAAAQETLAAHRQEINDLDGYNGNHGDNMVENVSMIVDALRQQNDEPPAAALERASERMRMEGRGGTSQYYAEGLGRAAQQVQGRSGLATEDALNVVQTLLASLPSEGYPDQAPAGESVLDLVLGMAQGQPAAQQQQRPSAMGGFLRSVLPLALALLRRKETTGSSSGIGEALLGALTGSQQMSPLDTGKPRPAAGGLLAQSLLSQLIGDR